MTSKQEFPSENVKTLSREAVADFRQSLAFSTWQWRELARLTCSQYAFETMAGDTHSYEEYKPVPWDIAEHELDLIPHMSVRGDGLVAFTQDAGKGERDIQTRIKVGRYLAKYRPDIQQATRERYSAEFLVKDPIDTAELHFATTGDDMIRVYRNGPKSCMRGRKDDYTYFATDEVHPVQVYAYGDLQLAYLTDITGKIHSRALVWPAEQQYGRVYPTADVWQEDGYENRQQSTTWHNKLVELLEAKDYHSGDLDGARVAKIRHASSGGFLMPYIDGLDYVKDCGDHFKITDSNYGGCYSASSTNGYVDSEDEDEPEYDFYCNSCSEGHYDDNCNSVAVHFGRYTGRETYCNHCARNDTFQCEVSGETCSDNLTQVEMHNGKTACLEYLEHAGGYGQCYGNDLYYPSDELHHASDDYYYSQDYIDANPDDFHYDAESEQWIMVKGIYVWHSPAYMTLDVDYSKTGVFYRNHTDAVTVATSSFCAF